MIKEKQFKEMKKSEKLKMPFADWVRMKLLEKEVIEKVLYIPIRRKMDGYGMSAIFIKSKLGWDRLNDYDCFKITVKAQIDFMKYVRGDFEYGGVVFFLENGKMDRFTSEFITKHE